jgi:peroxiredoxin
VLPLHNEAAGNAPSEALQKLLADLEALDREAAGATTPADQARFTARRAELLEQIAAAAKTPEERNVWLRQLADMLSAGAQSGTCPDGIDRLKALLEKLENRDTDKNLIAYIKFRQLTTSYVLSMQAAKADTAKIQAIQAKWLKTLESFAADYPTAPDAAEAMLQLAISQEFSGQEDEAKRWYARIVADFPDAPAARKAAGALKRLDCVGRALDLQGQTPTGRQIDISQYRGKIVLVQYWTTTSPAAKADMATLKEMWNKYGRSLAIVGVSLDNDVKDLNAYLGDNPLPWPQIFEEGGLDSRPANVLGILTIPTMILIDQDGKVVNRNVSTTELESEIKKLMR